ncbi:hypothetical protein P692DRAFT_20274364 [Suillus brevipes Sb2]|nr:hypothetical protein P692DRAFT_20274364 [Suillus brevipes Sb2]
MTCHVRVISCHLGLLSDIFPLYCSIKVMFNYGMIMQCCDRLLDALSVFSLPRSLRRSCTRLNSPKRCAVLMSIDNVFIRHVRPLHH